MLTSSEQGVGATRHRAWLSRGSVGSQHINTLNINWNSRTHLVVTQQQISFSTEKLVYIFHRSCVLLTCAAFFPPSIKKQKQTIGMLCNIISYYGANKGGIQDSKCPMQNRSRAKRGNKWKVKSRKANKAGGCKQTGQHALSERERLESFFSFLFLWRALVDAGSSFDEEPGRQNIEAGRQEWLWGYCPLSEASFFYDSWV